MKKFIVGLLLVWSNLHAESATELRKLKKFDINGIKLYLRSENTKIEINSRLGYLVNGGAELLFEKPLVLFTEKDGTITSLTSDTAVQDIITDEIKFQKNVIITSPMRKMTGNFFRLQPKENILFSDNNPVEIDYLYRETDSKKQTKSEQKKANVKAGNLTAKLFMINNSKEAYIVLNNNVKIKNSDGTLQAREARFFLHDDELENIVGTGNPVIFDGMIKDEKDGKKKKTHIEANSIDYIIKKNLIILKNNVKITSEDGATITADELTYNNKTGEMKTKNKKNKKTTIYLENIDKFQNETESK